MEFEGESLDDILIALYRQLQTAGIKNTGSRGEHLELIGVALRLTNPRARLSRSENRGKSFSAIGELFWYLSGKNDLAFIEAYVPAYRKDADGDGTIHGGYGPRLFTMRGNIDQFESVTKLLKERPSSRRAVMQLFNAEDIASPHKEVPCTTTIQFFLRSENLHMAATLRSNDAYKGLPHDVFCFTMLQEMMARRLGAELGEYYQYVGSMHVYTDNFDDLTTYIREGHHKLAPMPPMPKGDPFAYVKPLLDCEHRMRNAEYFDASTILNEPYWADLVRLLQAFWASGMTDRLDDLLAKFVDPMYRSYAETRRKNAASVSGKIENNGFAMWPAWEKEQRRIAAALTRHSQSIRTLPGVADKRALDTLAWQFVASMRREAYYSLVQQRPISPQKANPNHARFDAERAVAFHVQHGNIDEAAWLVFLMTHFGRPADTGWKRLKDVYGKLGAGIWDWPTVSANPAAFSNWLAANWGMVGGKFGNHRKYESLRNNSNRGTGKVVESYVAWIGPQGHRQLFANAVRNAGNNPHTIFDALYQTIHVKSFGRLAKFDYFSLLGRYSIAPIDAGSAYLTGATGPARGARLLFDGDPEGPSSVATLQRSLDALDADLKVSMKVMEDALCNWQKSPTRFVHFKG